ncbi:methyltransferase CmcJ [Cadophora sp. MPI-SDFR-AT-0126]|nr:methyltransferase CmcJ [Leotiomycetes sp. MPI-SDFR-AT-0126]
MSSGDVTTSLNFLQRLDLYKHEKPFEILMDIPKDAPDQRHFNTKFEAREHIIRDMRICHEAFTLDKNGFTVRKFHSSFDTEGTIDRKRVEEFYLPEVEKLIRENVAGVDQLFFFEWRLRGGDVQINEGDRLDINDFAQWITPAQVVHVDQSPSAVLNRVQLHMKEEAEYLLQGRVRIINVWKPIESPVEDFPLAVCDSSSMELDDLVECDYIRKKVTGATLYAHFNPNQKWCSRSIGDSIADWILGCPHSAFKHPQYQEGLPKRKSIEVRALVFTHPTL